MILVDTSAWIEWLVGSPTGKRISAMLPEPRDWLVPAMVQLDLAKWFMRELDEDAADRAIAFSQTCRIVPLDTHTALLAAELCREHRLATADAVMLATARIHHACLLTCDAHFEGLEGVQFIAKDRD